MNSKLKPWYKITYTRYIHWTGVSCKYGEHTTWCIDEYYTESIRKANKFLKEHPDGNITIVYR